MLCVHCVILHENITTFAAPTCLLLTVLHLSKNLQQTRDDITRNDCMIISTLPAFITLTHTVEGKLTSNLQSFNITELPLPNRSRQVLISCRYLLTMKFGTSNYMRSLNTW
jgi:hypothetical protein